MSDYGTGGDLRQSETGKKSLRKTLKLKNFPQDNFQSYKVIFLRHSGRLIAIIIYHAVNFTYTSWQM